MTDLSSVAREAAEAEGLRRIPPQWMAFHGGTTADMMAVYRKHFVDGFTECASRIPSEEELAEALKPIISEHHGADENDQWWVSDHASDYARAALSLIGEKISG